MGLKTPTAAKYDEHGTIGKVDRERYFKMRGVLFEPNALMHSQMSDLIVS